MKEVGLQPSSTGAPGGKEVGQKMADYSIEGGLFAKATAKLVEKGFSLSWVDVGLSASAKPKKPTRIKYTCPDCGVNAWGKPDLALFCAADEENHTRMEPEETDDEDA